MYYTKRGLQAVCIWVLCDAAVRRKKNPSVILPSWNYFCFSKGLKKEHESKSYQGNSRLWRHDLLRLEVRWPKLDKHLNNSKNVPHSLPITSANEAVFMLTISSIFCEKDGSPTHEYLRCQTCQLSRQNIYSYRNATLYGGSGHDCSRMRRCSVLEMANSAGLWIC